MLAFLFLSEIMKYATTTCVIVVGKSQGFLLEVRRLFGRPPTVSKTVRPMLSDRCLSVLSVCNVRALYTNGWTDQDETWHAGRPRPWLHCVRWGPSSPPQKGHSPQFSAHMLRPNGCMAWINMSLGIELCLGPVSYTHLTLPTILRV